MSTSFFIERNRDIERDNKILVSKLSRIIRGKNPGLNQSSSQNLQVNTSSDALATTEAAMFRQSLIGDTTAK